MAAASWPSTLPQCPNLTEWQEEPQPNVADSNAPVGLPRKARRSTAKTWIVDATFRMTNEQLLTFKTFFETTLLDGSLPFNWAHPITLVSYDWLFSPGDEPNIERFALNASTVQIKLLRLPP